MPTPGLVLASLRASPPLPNRALAPSGVASSSRRAIPRAFWRISAPAVLAIAGLLLRAVGTDLRQNSLRTGPPRLRRRLLRSRALREGPSPSRRPLQTACLAICILAGCNADPPRKSEPPVDPKTQIKELAAPKIDGGALKIDGVLDEEAWSKAAGTGLFVDVGSGMPNPKIPSQGEAKLFWDDKYLYVGVEAYDKTLRGGFPADAKDPHLWERDTVEIMIDPDGDGDNKDYYEIQIGPQNLVFDTQYDDYNRPNGGGKGPFGHEEWTFAGDHAVSLHGTLDNDADTDDGYTVEARIPWSAFSKAKAAPPAPGSSWRVNFYAMQSNGGTAWSPILGMGNFHKASRFGRVTWKTP